MKRFLPAILYLGFLALLLQPWRPITGQDDGSYASFSDRIAHGVWEAPNLLAFAYPQCVLGAYVARLLPTIPVLSTYMFLAFLAYSLNVVAFYRLKKDWALTFSVFLFPVTLQYGLGYLSEMFVLSLLLLYLVALQRWNRRADFLSATCMVALSILIMLQRQTFAVLPLAVFLFYAVRGSFRKGVPVLLGLVVSMAAYVLTPKTFLGTQVIALEYKVWSNDSTPVLDFVSRFSQYFYAAGLFVFPFAFGVAWSARKLVFALALAGVGAGLFFLAPIEPLSAGVLFTNYFPKPLSAIFLGVGACGLVPIIERLSRLPRLEIIAILIPWCLLCLFLTFMNASDVKYVLPAVVAGAIYLKFDGHRGALITYCVCVGGLSILVNRYYLDTVEARWKVAATLEKQGTDPRLISAGYGRDLYVLGDRCLMKVMTQIQRAPLEKKRPLLEDHVFKQVTRYFEDGAVFRYVVKPDVIMGRRLPLRLNTLAGQSGVPVSTYDYQVFGISNSLAVFENSRPVLPWCDRAGVKEQSL